MARIARPMGTERNPRARLPRWQMLQGMVGFFTVVAIIQAFLKPSGLSTIVMVAFVAAMLLITQRLARLKREVAAYEGTTEPRPQPSRRNR